MLRLAGVKAGRTTRCGNQVRYAGDAPPVRFVYTISYEDDLGPGTTTVEVPVRYLIARFSAAKVAVSIPDASRPADPP
jgi:hypothetical protein